MSDTPLIKTLQSIAEIREADWNACLTTDHPFVTHQFLKALEDSGSVSADSGWMPYHLALELNGTIAGIAPMYVKGHSQGEYVFDHSWAHAYERAGGRYYPKLQLSVPFSPVTGPRLLVPEGPERLVHQRLLLQGTKQVADKLNLSSVHATFLEPEERELMEQEGFLIRTGEQFHWVNENYETFDDFLAQLSSRKRKAIRKERKGATENDLEFEILTGNDIGEAHWDAFYHFYIDTGNRKWGTPYLNREFFSLLGERLGEAVVLFMVSRDGRYIAGALNLKSSDCLYGRYWGCTEDHRFLHFETCYYRAIDYAIKHGIRRVEAGAQGPHKLARGYLPTETYSAHWMRDPGFHDAVSDYLKAETKQVEAEINYLAEHSPFRSENSR
ncbi:GNAT family N-acetyltransferase [Sneathiella sp. HT1-7]|uniref:GNAT family N-acetyltransferase n=1 Tax=Sneathiella sp. HT1-7 TaxID=2887192 RepID=UPI001D14F8C2|nr:GNAT family N-acetyltransferase [Sneathiella sp. HT1-7]MCC3304697.1 GNAT family N-acetyltransferase [Sneathiella sp. HT1-7]